MRVTDIHTIELKSCPHCGGKSVFIPLSGCSGYIACIGECSIATKTYWDKPMTEPEGRRTKWYEVAAMLWNRRANDA